MIDNYHFTKSGAPTYFYDISETVKLGELLYREYNQGYILFLDDKQIIDITNNQEEYIKVNIQNQSYSVQQIKSMFKQLMVIRLNNNKKQQKLKLSENDGLIIQSQNNYVQATIYDFDEWCCVTILKILEDDEYEYIGNYYCENKEFLSFEFETIIQQKYLLINLNKCQMVFYNEYIIKYERVRCLKYLEYLVQQLHQTSFSNFRKIEFFNTLNKQSFLDQFLLKSDVIKWIAQNYDYEENQNYQLFKEIRYKDEIIYKIPEIFIALGKFAKFNYLYIHNQSIAGECLFGSISFEKNEILVDISPSQYFVYFYEGEQEPKFSLKSSIWRNRNPIKDYKIEIINKDKTKLINKIKQEGNIEDGQYVLETENKLYILFSQGMKLVNILNLFIHRIIGDCNQKDENEFYCYDEFCIVSYIKALDQQQYQYQVKFFN